MKYLIFIFLVLSNNLLASDWSEHYASALELYASKKLQEALKEYTATIDSLEFSNGNIYMERGRLRAQLGYTKEAIDDFNIALSCLNLSQDDTALIHMSRAMALAMQNELDPGIKEDLDIFFKTYSQLPVFYDTEKKNNC